MTTTNKQPRLKLGETYTDSVTGFSGVATARLTELSGEVHIALQPRVAEDGKIPESHYFSSPRIAAANPDQVTICDEEPGGLRCQLGETYTDRITGFTGMATGRIEHLTGCLHMMLQPKVDKDGKVPKAQSFDESRLDSRIAKPGGPADATSHAQIHR